MTKNNIASNKHFLPILIPVICGLLYIALASFNLAASVWPRESFFAYLTHGDFSNIWELSIKNSHAPLFVFLLKIWAGLFGSTDLTLRFMSIFFGAISIVLAFHFLRRHFDLKLAAIFTFILSISPALILCGREIQPYTVLLTFIISVLYVLDLRLKTKIFPAILAVIITLMSIFGITNSVAHQSHSAVKPVIIDLRIIAEKSEPIIIGDEAFFYDAVFYSTKDHPIFGFSDQINLEPAKVIQHNIITDRQAFIENTERFWYIVSPGQNLPDDSLRIMTEIAAGDFVALELTKK